MKTGYKTICFEEMDGSYLCYTKEGLRHIGYVRKECNVWQFFSVPYKGLTTSAMKDIISFVDQLKGKK